MRKITKEDIFLKARLLSEGARIEVKTPLRQKSGVVLDGCGIPVAIPHNPYSRLEAVFDDGGVTIFDSGEVLGEGRLAHRPAWEDEAREDADREDGGVEPRPFRGSMVSIFLRFRCHNQDSGSACRYCEKTFPAKKGPTGSAARSASREQARGAAQAIRDGWRGCLMMTGGVLPPARRHELTDLIELSMAELREALNQDLDEDSVEQVLTEIQIAPNTYPPQDLQELHAWKDLGINSTSFDLEVMDPAFWRAICPGKAKDQSHAYWKEASEASAELFGRGRGALTAVVLGIEPMSCFLEGVEERISKGVYTTPYFFVPPSQPVDFHGFRPPTADWLIEATEKTADIFFRYADTLEVSLLSDQRPGLTKMGWSSENVLVGDEMTRRLQEMREEGASPR